jgi:hypothetical protein
MAALLKSDGGLRQRLQLKTLKASQAGNSPVYSAECAFGPFGRAIQRGTASER